MICWEEWGSVSSVSYPGPSEVGASKQFDPQNSFKSVDIDEVSRQNVLPFFVTSPLF